MPGKFLLSQNYSNYFNPSTTIYYQLSATGLATLKVYDALGNEVRTLVNKVRTASDY